MRKTTLSARRSLYEQAHALVARDYRRRLTVPGVARELACSPRALQRAYAQFGETSFSEDLRERRLAVAAQLLVQQPSIAVCDVARLAGYGPGPHFAEAFGRRYGLAPAEFRLVGRAAGAERAAVAAAPRADTPAGAGRSRQ